MRYEWFIAKHYLHASRRAGFVSFITVFAILGVTIGTAAVIVALSIINGFEKEIKEKVFTFTSHVQVVGFQNQALSNYRHSIELVAATIPEVTTIAPFVAKEAMIRFKDKVDGIFLKGIDPTSDVQVSRHYLTEGQFLDKESRDPELIIGKKLADRLGVSLHEKVVVFGIPRQGGGNFALLQPRAMVFRVVGMFESGMSEYDDIYVYTTLEKAQSLFQLNESVLGFDVFLKDLNDAGRVAQQIQHLLGYPHYARTAAQLYRNLFAWIELQKKPAPILLGLIIIVATVNIIGTLLMLVLEKVHGIGVLKSIGASQGDIRAIFLIQGFVIAMVGVVLGNLLAYGLCWIQMTLKPFSLPSDIYFMSFVPVMMHATDFVLVSGIVLVLCVAAALLPSRAAARLDAINILRFN